ncbi:hypothetical protein EDB80DRAFT_676181 [Ilyonectria destructans]|nr:hypothetical protein EDB80DRAFT_676181 [Ilyonectria destructans]
MSAHRQVPSHFKEEPVAHIVSCHFPSSLAFASADRASSGLLSKRDRLVKLYLHLHDNKNAQTTRVASGKQPNSASSEGPLTGCIARRRREYQGFESRPVKMHVASLTGLGFGSGLSRLCSSTNARGTGSALLSGRSQAYARAKRRRDWGRRESPNPKQPSLTAARLAGPAPTAPGKQISSTGRRGRGHKHPVVNEVKTTPQSRRLTQLRNVATCGRG